MPDFSRRTLLGIAPTIATLIASEAGLEAQGRGQQDVPQRVSKEQLKAALEVIGLDFTEAQREQMLQGVNRALNSYDALRKIEVPLDTEPAFHFRPSLPGKEPKARPSKFTPSHSARLATFKDVEELAFLPVTDLAPLVKARKVSSTDLTKMYLARLKKYSPKLFNVITLTEDLALEQAARADEEIHAG